jgi:hypothetical protein
VPFASCDIFGFIMFDLASIYFCLLRWGDQLFVGTVASRLSRSTVLDIYFSRVLGLRLSSVFICSLSLLATLRVSPALVLSSLGLCRYLAVALVDCFLGLPLTFCFSRPVVARFLFLCYGMFLFCCVFSAPPVFQQPYVTLQLLCRPPVELFGLLRPSLYSVFPSMLVTALRYNISCLLHVDSPIFLFVGPTWTALDHSGPWFRGLRLSFP